MKRLIIFLTIPLLVLTLYYPVIFTYFSQDDFFHFKVSLTDGSFSQFVNLFGFHPFAEREIAFYRPIFREAIFNIFYSLFGLNPYPFRILQFILLFLNSFLAYILIQKIFSNNKLAFFVAIFYAFSSAQVSALYYLAGGIQVLGTTFFLLLTLIFSLKNLLLSLITFLLALASHELASITPFLIAALAFSRYPFNKALRKFWKILPFFLILFVYLYLEITKIGFSADEKQYQLVLNLKTVLNSYMWYMGWALGLPEMLVDFVLPGFKLNPTLMRYWGNYYLVIFSTFFASLFLLCIGFVYLLTRKRDILLNKKVSFFIFWFMLSLAPIILLPLHKSTQYLETGLAAFWTIVGLVIFNVYQVSASPHPKWEHRVVKILLVILVLSLFTLSATSAILQRTTYWAAQRGRLAQKLIDQVKSQYPSLPKGAIIYIENDPNYPFVAKEWGESSKQASLILNGSDALQLLYNDLTLKVFYEDLDGIPKDFPNNKIYILKAHVQ